MLILLRIGRWELTISRDTQEPNSTTDRPPIDTPYPMEIGTPGHVGFLPPHDPPEEEW